MTKTHTTVENVSEMVANKNRIVVDVKLVYNDFFDRVDTEYECAIYIVDEDVLSQCMHKSCVYKFLDSFCDMFADAVQDTDITTFNGLLNTASKIGFYIMYPEFVDRAMRMDAKIKFARSKR